jgi:hypothetical protein
MHIDLLAAALQIKNGKPFVKTLRDNQRPLLVNSQQFLSNKT